MSEKKSILCFGDSLTWGWIPKKHGPPSERYPCDQRWTGVMASQLGDGFHIIEEGLTGRTTAFDDPVDPRLNGANHLPTALATHLPLDLVIVMLGTNDAKACLGRTSYEMATGMAKLVAQILTCDAGSGTPYPAPRALVVAPPPLGSIPDPWFDGMYDGGHEKIAELAARYEALASFLDVDFFNAGEVVSADGEDGIHFTARNNVDLGCALAEKVKAIL